MRVFVSHVRRVVVPQYAAAVGIGVAAAGLWLLQGAQALRAISNSVPGQLNDDDLK